MAPNSTAGHVARITKTKRHIKLGIFLPAILLFAFIYPFTLPGFSSLLLSWRIAALILFGLAVVIGGGKVFINRASGSYRVAATYWKWQVFLFAYTAIILAAIGFGDSKSMLTSYIHMILFMPLFVYGITRLVKNTDSFMRILQVVSIVQSLIIIIGLIEPSFNSFINNTFNTSSYWYVEGSSLDRLTLGGYATGLACMTSTGVMQLSLGVAATSYFIISKKGKTPYQIIVFILITFAATALARTGLLVSFVALVGILAYKGKESTLKFLKALLIVAIVTGLGLFVVGEFNLHDQLEKFFTRLIQLQGRGLWDGFFESYFSVGENRIPEISIKTIIGTGIASGTSGNGVYINADGGFVRSYVSMGLILAIVNYSLIFGLLVKGIRLANDRPKIFLGVLVALLLFIGELKEPFIYKCYFMGIIFAMFAFFERDAKRITK